MQDSSGDVKREAQIWPHYCGLLGNSIKLSPSSDMMTIDDDDVNCGQLLITETVSHLGIKLVIEGKLRRHLINAVEKQLNTL